MTCKDCIHGELCDLMCEYCEELPTCLRPSPECAFFKDKSKLIELPCKAGDTLTREAAEKALEERENNG